MTELKLKAVLKIGKVLDQNGKEFGKIQISSKELIPYIGKKFFVEVIVHTSNE